MDDFFSFFVDLKDKFLIWFDAFNNSTFFFVVKVILILYITILIVDIILIIYLDGLRKRLRMQLMGSNIAVLSKKKKIKEWNNIKKQFLVSNNENQWKLTIIEIDNLMNSYLSEAGYQGENFTDKLAKIPKHFSSYFDAVIEAHNLKNEIIKNESLVLTKEETEKNVEIMEKFLKTINIL